MLPLLATRLVVAGERLMFLHSTFIGLGHKFLDDGSQLSLDSHEIRTQVWCGVKP